MALRPTVSGTYYFKGWREYDQNGNEKFNTGSQITAKTTYSLSYTGGNSISGDQYYPKSYTIIGFSIEDLDTDLMVTHQLLTAAPSVLITSKNVNPNEIPNGADFYTANYWGGQIRENLSLNHSSNLEELKYNDSNSPFLSQSYSLSNDEKIGVRLIGFHGLDISSTFNGTCYGYFYGIGSVNEPHISLSWRRCDPEVKPAYPYYGDYVNDKESISFRWTIFDEMISTAGVKYMPTEITVFWGVDNVEENEIPVVIDPNNRESYYSVAVPANTFPAKADLKWKVRWKSDAADEYFESGTLGFTTIDAVPTVEAIHPVSISVNGDVENTFSWKYSTNTGTAQTAFDLQISQNGGTSWTEFFSHTETSETSAVIPVGTLMSGSALWRVRAYNTDDVASAWSEPAQILVRAAPKAPTISKVTDTPRITIEWQSNEQQGFQIRANNYESNVVFGTSKTFTIPKIYSAGETVEISIRIKNRLSEWSNWATVSVTVVNDSPGTILLRGIAESSQNVLEWPSEGEFTQYYVLRDGIAVAKIDGGFYIDYTAAGVNEYKIMGIDDFGNYALSETIVLESIIDNGIISPLNNIDWISLKVKRGNIPEFISSKTESIYYQFYSGRRLPVAYSERFVTKTRTLDFTVRLSELEKLENLVGEMVIYKDYTGQKIIGICDSLDISGRSDRPDISMNITAIDYTEEVDYE